ncbi:DUF4157 domain-containing protein [Chloroflexales bacterium ZM16-3]|nr:DUF4157 domain-containing protein [Chloroflexales bacterium ZM16-3]
MAYPTFNTQHSTLNTQHSPLRESTRRFLRPLIGFDPTQARIFRGPVAAQVADSYGADAVAMGDTIALSAGHTEETPETIGLIAHELAHVARARTARFVPPIVGSTRAAPGMPTDEEQIALSTERAVTAAAHNRLAQDTPAAPPPPPPAPPTAPRSPTPDTPNPWGGLPAPWEPLPDWFDQELGVRGEGSGGQGSGVRGQEAVTSQQEIAPRSPALGVRPPDPRSQIPDPRSQSPVPRVRPPTSGPRPPTPNSQPPTPETGVWRAETSRNLTANPIAASETESAPPDSTLAPDLDDLARQIYAVLKRRLAAEARRRG